MLRRCSPADIPEIFEIVNEAATAYAGVIPAECWHEPYMPMEELEGEIADGVRFFGREEQGRLLGVMGIQDRGEVSLLRHAYVLTAAQRRGIGTELLRHLEALAPGPVLVGTWAAADWAVAFYRRSGYALLEGQEKDRLLRRFWKIPERQVGASVVLAKWR
jgi:GNAT superfamily N-acetyltransferase